ncbi:DUF3179 domain-containing protein [bacterium]|nr:DUF3179 domain-containing protein [bacterium]
MTAVFAGEPEGPALPGLIAEPNLFPTLVNPKCSRCKDEAVRRQLELRPDDRVLAWIRGKYDGGAIPARFFLVPYCVISDTYRVFVYDADAGFMQGFESSLDFRFHGYHHGVMVIRHKDGTLYSALSGRGLTGPNKDKRLHTVPTLATNWGDWTHRYPDTVAYDMFPKYQPKELPTLSVESSLNSRIKSKEPLKDEDWVLGLEHAGRARAYPLYVNNTESHVWTDRIGDEDVNILWFGPTATAVAYVSAIEGVSDTVQLVIDQAVPQAPGDRRLNGDRIGR